MMDKIRYYLPLIFGIIMGCLVILLLIAVFTGDGSKKKKKEDKLYHNIELKIVSINGDTSTSKDKIFHPQECNFILFETTSDNKLYMELNSCDLKSGCGCNKIHIDRKWVYSHRPGDIVHFDYILKERFFNGHKNE